MTSKRKALDEISGRVSKSPVHLTPTKDPQSSWMEGIESDPYSNDKYYEGTTQETKAVAETMPEISRTTQKNFTYSDYTVGWICALPETELAAACAMLDEEHPVLPAADGDTNIYLLGKIGSHNVVIACLPDGSTGKSSAATVAKDMLRSFKEVSKATAEGSDEEDEEFEDIRDIRLGDVVISLHSKSSEAVVQYDFGKSAQGVFFRTGTLNKPPHILCAAVGALKARHVVHGNRLSDHLSKISDNPRLVPKFQYQGSSKDQLFKTNIVHLEGRKTCKDCCGTLNANLVERKERHDTSPALHYGTIGSADQVMKDSTLRDKWAKKENIICFEMEAAGLMDSFSCLVIRGICDYADSHKNKRWQPYAAATAAAYAKELLYAIPGAEVTKMPTINEAIEKFSADLAVNTAVSRRVEEHVLTAEELSILDWLSSSNFFAPQNNAQASRTPGTGEWLLKAKEYTYWRDFSAGLLWLHGVAGCGKSILSSGVIEDLQQLCKRDQQKRLAYWYFQFSDVNTQNVCNMLQSLLRQLSSSLFLSAIRGLWDRHRKSGSKPSTEELIEAVRNIIKRPKQHLFIVMDALDECPLPERKKLLECIDELRSGNNRNVHILVTSRREPDIDAKLKEPPTVAMNIEERFRGDIKLFVGAALHKDTKLSRWDQDSKSQIKRKLAAVNETRFRWADLQIKRLQSCRTKPELINALNTVPESLEKSYEEALQKIPAKDEKLVQKILMWLASSFRPMALEEIAAVVSFPFTQDVLELCTSLLVTLIDEGVNQTIKLAHFSVKEYLILTTQQRESFLGYRFKNELAQAVISEMAVTYLLDPNKLIRPGKNVILQSLLEYSATFWPQHAVEAFSSDDPSITSELQAQIDLLFSPDYSSRYIAWLKIHDPDPDERYHFDRKPKTCYPQPLYYASLLGLQMTVKNLLEKGYLIIMEEGAYGNACNAAAIRGNFEIVECLGRYHKNIGKIANLHRIAEEIRKNAEKVFTPLLKADSGALISHNVVKAAAGNSWSGKELIMLLLEQRGEDVIITEEVVKAAARNWGKGKEVMMLLFEKRREDILITEEVVKAAARNWGKGEEVMMLLLEKRKRNVVITEEVVKIAAGNPWSGKELIMLLFEQRRENVVITEKVVKAAAKNSKSGKEVMMLLLAKKGGDVIITEEMVKLIAEKFDNEVMMLLLAKRGEDVVITEKVVKAAAKNSKSGREVVMLLLAKREGNVMITKEIVKLIAEKFGIEVMMLLLAKQGGDVVITEEIVKLIAEKFNNEVMMLLLAKQREDLVIPEKVVKLIAEKSNTELMMLLLAKQGGDIVITEEVVKLIAENFDNEVMMLLLAKQGEDLVITEEVVKLIAGKFNTEVMMLLLAERGENVVITEEVVKAAAGNLRSGEKVMLLLFEQRGKDVLITEEIVKVAAGNLRSGEKVMLLLFEQRGKDVLITEEIVKAAAGNPWSGTEVMMLLLKQRGKDVIITEEVVKAAAENWKSGDKVMMLLFRQRGEEVLITEKVVKAAAGNRGSGDKVMMLLFKQRGGNVIITEEVVKAAAGNGESGDKVMMLLFEQRGKDVIITEEVVKAAAGNGGSGDKVMMLLFEQRGKNVIITEEVVKAAAGNGRSGDKVMMLLFEQRGKDVIITEEVVKAAAGNERSGDKVIMLLLEQRGADIVITEKVVKTAAGNLWSGKKVMMLLLKQRGGDIMITKEMVKLIAENFDKEVMMLLTAKRGEMQ